MITQERMEAAMDFLAGTDVSFAEAKMALERSAILQKRVRARVFLTADGSVEQRKAIAEIHADSGAADDQYCECVKVFEETKAKRQRAELVIEVWRSINASLRRG